MVTRILAAAILLLSSAAQAHSFVELTNQGSKTKNSEVGGAFAVSKTDYKTKDGKIFTLDRKSLGFSSIYDVGEGTNVFVQMGRTVRAELEDFSDYNGDGYEAGAGLSTLAYRGEKSAIYGYGRFNYQSEDMSFTKGDQKLKSSLDFYEFSVGLLASLTTNPKLHPYAALEVYPINQGKIKSKVDDKSAAAALAKLTENSKEAPDFSKTIEFQRSDILGMRIGAATHVQDFTLRGEMTMITETTFLVGAGFSF